VATTFLTAMISKQQHSFGDSPQQQALFDGWWQQHHYSAEFKQLQWHCCYGHWQLLDSSCHGSVTGHGCWSFL